MKSTNTPRTRIVPSAIVGGYDLISNRTDKVLITGKSFTVCSNVQADCSPESEAAEVATFLADWSELP